MLSETSYNALKQFRGGLYTGPTLTPEIREFRDLKYINPTSRELKGYPGQYSMNYTTWSITSLGEDVLSEFEQKREQQAKDERDRRFNQKISIAQVFVPLVTFLLGLVVEHYSGLVSALSEFLGRWIK